MDIFLQLLQVPAAILRLLIFPFRCFCEPNHLRGIVALIMAKMRRNQYLEGGFIANDATSTFTPFEIQKEGMLELFCLTNRT
jgi:hypothetical protein